MSEQPGRWYSIPPVERDKLILALRRRGWTYRRIGKRVGMSESGVARSLDRIREGGYGQGQAPR
jgi:transposase